jgi:hypothetical protein
MMADIVHVNVMREQRNGYPLPRGYWQAAKALTDQDRDTETQRQQQ